MTDADSFAVDYVVPDIEPYLQREPLPVCRAAWVKGEPRCGVCKNCVATKPAVKDWKHDDRPMRHGWAPGEYIQTCKKCGDGFIGAKRCSECADCAYARPLFAGAKIIGLTGLRNVGKSTVADHLKAQGWKSVHPFGGGKVMVLAYLDHLGIPQATAERMVYGDLKDVPHPSLPGGVSCRVFMEKLGYFMPAELGPEWTIGVELQRARIADPSARLIVESVVYEAEVVRAAGGKIIRVVRPDFDAPEGLKTDAAQADIVVDHTIVNDGNVEDLLRQVDAIF